jgi:hypothetical protein
MQLHNHPRQHRRDFDGDCDCLLFRAVDHLKVLSIGCAVGGDASCIYPFSVEAGGVERGEIVLYIGLEGHDAVIGWSPCFVTCVARYCCHDRALSLTFLGCGVSLTPHQDISQKISGPHTCMCPRLNTFVHCTGTVNTRTQNAFRVVVWQVTLSRALRDSGRAGPEKIPRAGL